MTIELDIHGHIMARKLPGIEVEPVVWNFDLIAVVDLLFEDAITISQPISPCRIVQGSQAVKEAGSQSAETPVAKCSIVFLADDVFDAET
jgi:hypothetical protein